MTKVKNGRIILFENISKINNSTIFIVNPRSCLKLEIYHFQSTNSIILLSTELDLNFISIKESKNPKISKDPFENDLLSIINS